MEGEEKRGGGFLEFIKVVVISLVIVLPIRAYVAQPFIVEGDSMEPNFSDGQYLIIDELSYNFKNPERGDVIVLRSPMQPAIFFIKRIIGLPGEEIKIEGGKIIITGTNSERIILNEEYIPSGLDTTPNSATKLNDNEYFVLGDNRNRSSDSRSWGPLPQDKITGRAFLRLWPLSKISLLK